MPDPAFVHAAFSSIAERYVTANHILSMGTDVMWRQRVVQRVAEWKPRRLLDIATGTGDLALAISRALPEVEVLGTDFCRPMLDVAVRRGLTNVLEADALHLPLPDDVFDAATVAFGLRNMADYAAALREFRRVLRPGGHLLVLDFSMPEGILAAPYRLYLHRVLPKIAGRVTGNSGAYDYLGESIEAFPRGADFCRLMTECGYTGATCLPLCMGIASIYTAEA
ncbi:MAG: ubiquinone/menaquinone biosynthesis methyltransferase [Akkermansia sp.]|nr:ubiquinone/menaquinone biosynthesis methyltransferase [Akkermansia sp.]